MFHCYVLDKILISKILFMNTDIGSGTGTSSISLDVSSSMSSRVRACIEAILVHKLVSYFTPKLNDAHLYRVMIDVEMPTVLLLANMELNGIG